MRFVIHVRKGIMDRFDKNRTWCIGGAHVFFNPVRRRVLPENSVPFTEKCGNAILVLNNYFEYFSV